MDFELGGVTIQAGFPLDVTLLCVGLVAFYAGLVRKHGELMAPQPGERAVTTGQAVSFTSGVALFWLVDGWPMQALSEHLFSVHMVQHLLQAFVIPPLLLLGIPRWMGDVLVRGPRTRRIVRRLGNPIAAGLVFNLVLLGTHAPIAIQWQLESNLFHAFDHLVLIGTGVLMWLSVYSPIPDVVPRLKPLPSMFYLFLMTLLPTIPSAFLVFGDATLYPAYEQVARPWDVGVLDDMQVAGLVMKLGGGFYLWTIIAVKYFRWAGAQERADRARRRERAGLSAAP
jgi:putative membrane protein